MLNLKPNKRDSFVSLGYADGYHSGARSHNTQWAEASNAEREQVLRWAYTLLLPLPWSVDHTEWSELDIPEMVAKAQAEFAFFLLREDRTYQGKQSKTKSKLTGVAESTFRENSMIPDVVMHMLGKYLDDNDAMRWGLWA